MKIRLFLFACTMLSLPAVAQRPVHEIVGADADCVIHVADIPALAAKWDAHPLESVLTEPALMELYESVLDSMHDAGEDSFEDFLSNEFELTEDEFWDLFSGQFSIVIFGLADALASGDEPELLLLIDYGGETERLHELLDRQFERNAAQHKEADPAIEHRMFTESFMGETLYFDERSDGETTVIEDGYALVEGSFILASTKERLRATVEGIKSGPDEPLSKRENFRTLYDDGGAADAYFFMDFDRIWPPLLQAFKQYLAGLNVEKMGLTPDAIADAIGLDAFHSVYVAGRLEPARVAVYSALAYESKRGLAGFLAYDDGPLPMPAYVPEDPLASSVGRYDFSAAIGTFETMLFAISPFYGGMFETYLKSTQEATGVDLRASMMENLGSGISTYSSFNPEYQGPPTIDQLGAMYAFEVRDTAAMERALETLKGMVPGFDTVMKPIEFEGHTLYHLDGSVASPGDDSAQDVSYTLTRTHLLLSVGHLSMLREALTRMDAGGTNFWASDTVERLFAPIDRPRKISRSYTNLQPFVGSMLETVGELWRMADSEVDFDLEAIGEALDVPYVVISEGNLTDWGIASRALLLSRDADATQPPEQ